MRIILAFLLTVGLMPGQNRSVPAPASSDAGGANQPMQKIAKPGATFVSCAWNVWPTTGAVIACRLGMPALPVQPLPKVDVLATAVPESNCQVSLKEFVGPEVMYPPKTTTRSVPEWYAAL